ncbi:MAG TPA: hypothetical protein VGN72_23145 [Tepidisphaeraceae bacterium]|nr:hypothetical protein [Tepidisphaeraceae bacterium]
MADVAIADVSIASDFPPPAAPLIVNVPARPARPSSSVLSQIAHRLSAVAVLLLAGGLAAAYAGRETVGAGSKVLVVALAVIQFAAVAALLANRRARRRGERVERGIVGFCAVLLVTITLALVADQLGWLQRGAMAINDLFASLSTQDVPRRRFQ